MNSRLAISTITGFQDTNPTKNITTWGEFVGSLRVPFVRGCLPLFEYLAADKATRDRQKDGCAIIAGTFSRPGTRIYDDFESLSLVTLDLDNSPYAFNELCERLKRFESVVFTSYSHSEKAPKYRAYLPLARPITGQIKTTLERLIDFFDEQVGYLDPACRKPTQLFYAPACPPGGEGLFQYCHLSGVRLDPADFLDVAALPQARSYRTMGPERTAIGCRPGDLYEARANWTDLLEPLGWKHCYRNHWTRPGKVCGVSGSILDAGFYVHSSDPATAPFVSGRTYTLFGAYAAIHHDGNHSAAARELRKIENETKGR